MRAPLFALLSLRGRRAPVAIRFPISALDYGNGDKVQYSYDDKGRVLSATYEDGDTLTRKAAPLHSLEYEKAPIARSVLFVIP